MYAQEWTDVYWIWAVEELTPWIHSLKPLHGMIKGINWTGRSICPFIDSLNIALLEYTELVMWSYVKDSVNKLHVIVIA